MKKHVFWFVACCAIILAFTSCEQSEPTSTGETQESPDAAMADASNAMSKEDLIKEGERLVEALDCNICHSPKVFTEQGPTPDKTRRLSGHPADMELPAIPKDQVGPGKWTMTNDHLTAWVGPWGVSYAANLTPDNTGLGAWTLDNFKKAIREGKSKGLDGSRMLLPPMPWQAYSHLTDEELEAIFTYLQSVPAVSNVVPVPKTPDQL